VPIPRQVRKAVQSGNKSGNKAMPRADSQQQGFLGTKMERNEAK